MCNENRYLGDMVVGATDFSGSFRGRIYGFALCNNWDMSQLIGGKNCLSPGTLLPTKGWSN